ncbi:MAG: hypothetical protein J0I79_15815 [Mesorhizobium sp.]|uniref:hypothetical protein n=1 Tax=Mesorhizobium sp. TaxID=1871066 RepID=UPI001AC3BEDD|nr:hypothetical protein [Mesorhizobium sp.]MBN9219414.1 hypothetical protein [Mesorhizobium sp.]
MSFRSTSTIFLVAAGLNSLGILLASAGGGAGTNQTIGQGVSQAGSQEQKKADPVATIALVVSLTDRGKEWKYADHMTKQLASVLTDGWKRADEAGENIWDGDILTGAQDAVRFKLLEANVVSNDGHRAVVVATVGMAASDTEQAIGSQYRYKMRWEGGKWRIDDIIHPAGLYDIPRSLKETFLAAGKTAYRSD